MDDGRVMSQPFPLPSEDGEGRSIVGLWAWAIACAPLLLSAVVVWYLVTWSGPSLRAVVVMAAVLLVVVGSTLAALRDIHTLAGRGVRVGRGWAAAVLLFYPVAAPAYLISRTRKVGSTALMPVMWFVSLAVLVVAPAFVPA